MPGHIKFSEGKVQSGKKKTKRSGSGILCLNGSMPESRCSQLFFGSLLHLNGLQCHSTTQEALRLVHLQCPSSSQQAFGLNNLHTFGQSNETLVSTVFNVIHLYATSWSPSTCNRSLQCMRKANQTRALKNNYHNNTG